VLRTHEEKGKPTPAAKGPLVPRPFIPRDKYARRAAKEGFLARSAYKLQEIDGKFHLLRPGRRVLDIGCAPGSWLQVASRAVGPSGLVVGVDLKPAQFVARNVRTFVCDVTAPRFDSLVEPFAPFDVVLSDAAPSTTGIRDRDQAASLALCERAAEIGRKLLFPGGSFVVKLFESGDTAAFRKRLTRSFRRVALFKPAASRDRSYETYLVAVGKR